MGVALEVVQLGSDKVSIVLDPKGTDGEAILDAAAVNAIRLIDEFENRVWLSAKAGDR